MTLPYTRGNATHLDARCTSQACVVVCSDCEIYIYIYIYIYMYIYIYIYIYSCMLNMFVYIRACMRTYFVLNMNTHARRSKCRHIPKCTFSCWVREVICQPKLAPCPSLKSTNACIRGCACTCCTQLGEASAKSLASQFRWRFGLS
jgi:hypothetical protein